MNLKTQLLPAMVAMLFSCNAFAGTSALSTFPKITFHCDTIPAGTDSVLAKVERVEEEVSFPGGEKAWLQYLQKNIDTTIAKKNKAPAGTYTVVVQFVFDREGNTSDVKALTNHGYGMEGEVVRVIKKTSRWMPAKQNGRIVIAYRKESVTFHVEGKKKKKNKHKDG
jgi:hypothetical protein